MADQPALSIPVPLYRRPEGRLSFLPSGHADPIFMEVVSSRRIDIDYVEDLATIVGVREPFTPIGVAVAGKSAFFGLAIGREPGRLVWRTPTAPDAPPPPSHSKKKRSKK